MKRNRNLVAKGENKIGLIKYNPKAYDKNEIQSDIDAMIDLDSKVDVNDDDAAKDEDVMISEDYNVGYS